MKKVVYAATLAAWTAGQAYAAEDLFRVMFRAECMTLGKTAKELTRTYVTERTIIAEALGANPNDRVSTRGYALVYNSGADKLQVVDPAGRPVTDVLQFVGGTSVMGDRYAHRLAYAALPDDETNIVGSVVVTERGSTNVVGGFTDRPAIFARIQLALNDGMRLGAAAGTNESSGGFTNTNGVSGGSGTGTDTGTNTNEINGGGSSTNANGVDLGTGTTRGTTNGVGEGVGSGTTNTIGSGSNLSSLRVIDIVGTGGATGITGTGGATGIAEPPSSSAGIGTGGTSGITSGTNTSLVNGIADSGTNSGASPGPITGNTNITIIGPPSIAVTNTPLPVATPVQVPIPALPSITAGDGATKDTAVDLTDAVAGGITNGSRRVFFMGRDQDDPKARIYTGIFMTGRRFVPVSAGLGF